MAYRLVHRRPHTDGGDGPKRIALPEPYGAARRWPHLVMAGGLLAGETFRALGSESVIGRAADADIRLLDGQVSRRHARLLLDGDRLTIEDLGASNGTLVDGSPVGAPRVLDEGDVITLGRETKLRLVYSPILDKAVRPERSQLAMDSADFLDGVRIGQVRARVLDAALTVALLRIDGAQDTATAGDARAPDQAMRKVAAIVRDTVTQGCLLARSSEAELVVVFRCSSRNDARAIDRIQRRVERSPSLDEMGSAPIALTAAVLPVSAAAILTPETILCALGVQGRRAMVNERNRVVNLQTLDVQALSNHDAR